MFQRCRYYRAAGGDEQLLLIDHFLSRTRQLTAAYASHLSGHAAPAAPGT